MPTPFPPNKTIKELGIDTTRKFVVVSSIGSGAFNKGDILTLKKDDDTECPDFRRSSDGSEQYCPLSNLAYADEPGPSARQVTEDVNKLNEAVSGASWKKLEVHESVRSDGTTEVVSITGVPSDEEKKEPYVPRVGDRVSLEGEILEVYETDTHKCDMRTPALGVTTYKVSQKGISGLRLLSRRRTMTKSEAEKILKEKLGEDVTIE